MPLRTAPPGRLCGQASSSAGGLGEGQEGAGSLKAVLDDERDASLFAEPGLPQPAGEGIAGPTH